MSSATELGVCDPHDPVKLLEDIFIPKNQSQQSLKEATTPSDVDLEKTQTAEKTKVEDNHHVDVADGDNSGARLSELRRRFGVRQSMHDQSLSEATTEKVTSMSKLPAQEELRMKHPLLLSARFKSPGRVDAAVVPAKFRRRRSSDSPKNSPTREILGRSPSREETSVIAPPLAALYDFHNFDSLPMSGSDSIDVLPTSLIHAHAMGKDVAVSLTPTSIMTATSRVATSVMSASSAMAASMPEWLERLVYWREPRLTAAALGLSVNLVLAIAWYSIISVIGYIGLLLLGLGMTLRFLGYTPQSEKIVVRGVKISLTMKKETAQWLSEYSSELVLSGMAQLRELYLGRSMWMSARCAASLWMLTYVGAWMNGTTAVLITLILLFTIPRLYEMHQVAVDAHLATLATKWTTLVDRARRRDGVDIQTPD